MAGVRRTTIRDSSLPAEKSRSPLVRSRRLRLPLSIFVLASENVPRYVVLSGLGGEADMKELVEMIAKALVDNPEQVSVTEVEGEQTTVLELRVAPSDLGKVIGKQGRTARCIRTLLGAAGMKLKKRFVLEILE